MLAVAESRLRLQTPRPGWSEQDPELWWTRGRGGARRAQRPRRAGDGDRVARSDARPRHARRRDQVLRPALLWNDQRTAAEAAEIEDASAASQRSVEQTGQPRADRLHRPEAALDGTPRAGAPRADSERAAAQGLRAACGSAGEHATDVTDASGTLWFDVRRRRGAARCSSRAGRPERRGCQSRSSRRPVSGSTPDRRPGRCRRRRSGRRRARGRRDRVRADRTAAGGPERSRSCSAPRASSAAPRPLCGRPARPPAGSCHALADAWFSMGVMLSAAGSLAWLARVASGDPTPATLAAEAAAWGPGCEGLIFLPYLTGERSPHHDPGARGAFVGLSARHDRGALARAVMEGVAFGLRDSLDLVRSLGQPVEAGARQRRRRAQRAVAADPRLGARAPARAGRSRGGRRLRRGAARRRGRRAVARPRGGRQGSREDQGHGRPRPRLGRGLRRGAAQVQGPVSGAPPLERRRPLSSRPRLHPLGHPLRDEPGVALDPREPPRPPRVQPRQADHVQTRHRSHAAVVGGVAAAVERRHRHPRPVAAKAGRPDDRGDPGGVEPEPAPTPSPAGCQTGVYRSSAGASIPRSLMCRSIASLIRSAVASAASRLAQRSPANRNSRSAHREQPAVETHPRARERAKVDVAPALAAGDVVVGLAPGGEPFGVILDRHLVMAHLLEPRDAVAAAVEARDAGCRSRR